VGGGELANAALIVLDKRAQGGVNTDAKWMQQALLAAGCKHARIVGAREFSAGVPGNFRATFFIEHIPREAHPRGRTFSSTTSFCTTGTLKNFAQGA
jgi:hypothetical protein